MAMRAHDRRVGRLIGGKWRVERVLGEGATATVYAAVHRDDGRRAAIKVLSASLARDEEVVRLFFREAALVGQIEHPGVARVIDDGVTDDGCPFLVLELLVGRTLDELRQLRGGRIPLDEVMPIADAIMDALAAIHDVGIVHRDLKPQNVMVLEGGGIKLVDFGLAKLQGHTAHAAQDVVGTPSFMPPEQALGVTKKMDAQSDVWALGATLFFVLSGQPVHPARHVSAMLLASASVRPRSLADAAPELPRAVVDVVDRALAYRKGDRWPDARAMRSAWQTAHPAWLPTLPPPSFWPREPVVDRAAGIETPLAMALFDPRDLVLELEATPAFVPSTSVTAPSRPRPSPSWGKALALAAVAAGLVGLVATAVLLAADDRPRVAASPPPAEATASIPMAGDAGTTP